MNYIKEAYKKGYRVTNEGVLISNKGRIISKVNKNGYNIFAVRVGEKTPNIGVHRLQAYQKYGDKMFEDGIEVRHKNNIKTDNSWDNILIGTHKENMMDIPEHIRIAKSLHATSFCRKYNKAEIIEWHNNNGCSYKKTMTNFNISSKGTLHFILNK